MSEPAIGPVVVRPEAAADRDAVRRVNELAFEGAVEADLVEALHREGLVLSSLVAEIEGAIVGHILFSRMWVDMPAGTVDAACLAPLAVEPSQQRRGIGSTLVRSGLETVTRLGERLVIVVGHPGYYSRFGFERAQAHGLTSPFPDDVFMVLEMTPGALRGAAGAVRYPAAFGI